MAAVPGLGRDLGQRRVMANGQLVGRPGHNFADAAGTERVPQSGHSRTGSCVHTRSVGFAFLVPRSGPWYWMGTTLPTADGTMELTAYEIQVNFPVRHRVVIENGIHLTLCDVERFFVQVLVMDFFAPVLPSDDGQSEGGSLPSTHSVFGTSEEVEVEVEVEVEDEAEEELEEVEVESELEEVAECD